MNWENALTVFAILATNLITVITLYCHLDNKTDKNITAMREEMKGIREDSKAFCDALRQETTAFCNAVRQDMKDFHGRLCAIEERYRSK